MKRGSRRWTLLRRSGLALLAAAGGLLIRTPTAFADAALGPRRDSWLLWIGPVAAGGVGVVFVSAISWLALRRFAAWRRQPRPNADGVRKEDAS